jgi:hypothetical protein
MSKHTTDWKTTNQLVNRAIRSVTKLIDYVDQDIAFSREKEYVGLLTIDFNRKKELEAALKHLTHCYK